jgi:hypothetical protein
MTPRDLGPPNETAPPVSRGRPSTSPSPTPATTTEAEAGTSYSTGNRRQRDADTWRPEVGARQRRRASRRIPPIGACSCVRDPLTDRHRCDEISDRQLQGAVAAAHHILAAGCLPIFDLPTLRALWKSGHHQLVDELRGGDR